MKASKLRKVPYRVPETDRIVWGIVLAESKGMALLFVRSFQKGGNDHLAIAAEKSEGVFEAAGVSAFPIKRPQLLKATATLALIGGAMTEEDIADIVKPD
jgi:hypothetical protein